MKSVTKYISLLAIAILAVSTLGACAALAPKESHTPGESFTLEYVIGESVYIDEKTKLVLATIFDQKGLNASEYYSIDKPYLPYEGIEFITFNKWVAPMKATVSTFVGYNNTTHTVDFVDDYYTINVFQ